MPVQLTLLCCAATASARAGGFARRDEPLDAGGLAKAQRRSIAPRPNRVLRSPALAAEQTAATMGLDATVENVLADMDFGMWEGRAFAEIDPPAFASWIARPEDGTPGGETLAQLRARIYPLLDALAGRDGAVLAITHTSTIRAILAEAIGLPDPAAMRFDVAPLSTVRLSFHRAWRVALPGGD